MHQRIAPRCHSLVNGHPSIVQTALDLVGAAQVIPGLLASPSDKYEHDRQHNHEQWCEKRRGYDRKDVLKCWHLLSLA
jgi:hypothetical protein